jgi:S-adenosylmethionine synthetase
MTTSAKVDITSIAKNTAMPLMEHGETIKVYNYLSTQSPDIAMGVNIGGAGD